MKDVRNETENLNESSSSVGSISFHDLLIILLVCLVTGLLILLPTYSH